MRNYKADIKINEHDLETDWMTQASHFLYYAEEHANALHNRDMMKAKADYIYAVMYSEIKKDWEKHFEIKPTEPAIKEFIAKSKKFKIAEKKYIDAAKDANIMLGVKTAFEHRKLALSNLTSLKISGFYAEPRNKQRDVENLKMKGGYETQKKALNRRGSRAKTRLTKKIN